MKKISVLIPAFNANDTVALAVESMLWQEIPPDCHYEVVVLDDGSTDGTGEVLQRLASRDRGARLRVLSNQGNLGIVRSLNRLIEVSDADYFVRMDADDVSLPGRIVAQVAALDAGSDLVGTFAYNFGSMHGDRQYGSDPLHHKILAMIDQRSFCHPAIAFNRKVAKIGYRWRVPEDYGLLTDLLIAGLKITTVPRHYLMYRVHERSLSSASDGARFARLREAVCDIRAGYIARLLGLDDAQALNASRSVENNIFGRTAPEDPDTLARLSALVRQRLGVGINFSRS
jgi:glycosyltransferase involved in cell wall biosynthesis